MSDRLEALQQELAGLFDRLASKIFKKPLDVKGIEQLHKVTRRIGFLVIQASERTALEVAKRLNDATGAGFQKVQKDIENLQEQVKNIREILEEMGAKDSPDE